MNKNDITWVIKIYKFSYKCKWMAYATGLFRYGLETNHNCNMKNYGFRFNDSHQQRAAVCVIYMWNYYYLNIISHCNKNNCVA